MLIKTQAIVLHSLPYSDNQWIVHLYTEDFGRVHYMATLSRNKGSQMKRALFQPLSIIEVVADHKGSKQLQRLKEARMVYPCYNLCQDMRKNAISLFLAEVLYRSARENQADSNLYHFLSHSIQWLDVCTNGVSNFHLVFLIKLSRYYGFFPNLEGLEEGKYFDLQGGAFVASQPLHNAWLKPTDAQAFAGLMRINYENMSAFKFQHGQRLHLLRQMLNYFRIHLVDFPEIKSLEVMEEIFSDTETGVPGSK